MTGRFSWLLCICVLQVALLAPFIVRAEAGHPLEPLDLSSPRATLNSFLTTGDSYFRLLRDEYWDSSSRVITSYSIHYTKLYEPLGTPNEVAFFNGVNEMPADVQMKWYDVWGTEETYNHMSAGWSWAFDTPFDWFKQNASRLGGINQNMVVSWPAQIKDKGGLREQFIHVIDVVPTILEAAGIPAPEEVDGIKQAPIEGTSFLYTFDAKNADVPSRLV